MSLVCQLFLRQKHPSCWSKKSSFNFFSEKFGRLYYATHSSPRGAEKRNKAADAAEKRIKVNDKQVEQADEVNCNGGAGGLQGGRGELQAGGRGELQVWTRCGL